MKKRLFTLTLVFSFTLLVGSSICSSCVDQNKLKEELKAEMEQERQLEDLQKENERLKADLESETAKAEEAEKKVQVAKAQTKHVEQENAVTVPDKVKIRDADNAGVVLRTRPSDSSKLTGSNNPHFFTGYVFQCVGISGSYYKVYFDGGYFFIPKRYASPYYGGSLGGPMNY